MQVSGIFVYGSLKRGEANQLLVSNSQRCEPATARGSLYHKRNGFPAMTVEGDGWVRGEYLEFQDMESTLRRLDRLESFDAKHPQSSHYQRIPLEVVNASGNRMSAWAYVYSADKVRAEGGRLVPNGDWHGSRLQRWTIGTLRRLERALT